jgi:hypothetical protein
MKAFLVAVLLASLVTIGGRPGRTAHAAPAYVPHWTLCTLHYSSPTHFVSKGCVHYPIQQRAGQRPTGHWWREIKHTPILSVRITYPTFAPVCSINPNVGPGVTRWGSLICSVAARTGVSARVIAAVIWEESRGQNAGPGGPCNQSTDGYASRGLMQLIPQTAASVMGVSIDEASADLCDPTWNVTAGARYLHELEFMYGCAPDYWLFACYNGGPGGRDGAHAQAYATAAIAHV